MKRYNNSFRMVHFNSANICDAVTVVDEKTYNAIKMRKVYGVSFHGNGVVKTINVHDFYPLYETIRNMSLKRRLQAIK